MGAVLAGRPLCVPHSQALMGAGLAGRPLCVPHSQVLMGAGLVGIPLCVPHSQALMSAVLAGRPPCLPHSQVLMGAVLAGRPPCLPHNQVLMGDIYKQQLYLTFMGGLMNSWRVDDRRRELRATIPWSTTGCCGISTSIFPIVTMEELWSRERLVTDEYSP